MTVNRSFVVISSRNETRHLRKFSLCSRCNGSALTHVKHSDSKWLLVYRFLTIHSIIWSTRSIPHDDHATKRFFPETNMGITFRIRFE